MYVARVASNPTCSLVGKSMEYCKNGEGVNLERMIQYYSLQILCVFVAELFKDTHTKKDHTNKQNFFFFRGKNAKMLIHSHGRTENGIPIICPDKLTRIGKGTISLPT